ncbi:MULTISPECIES: response regulator [Paenibacillus]|uniref:Response regulator n=1 Tax=Paenibacillus albilobatus TaxID=2716884 RepID=A0A919XF06_9BACL|nr:MULTISPECIES: response regulator [Paenibacillus]GIO29632.1 hypothetical protein J2TS6_07730 [Paenibacillus albilobatus]
MHRDHSFKILIAEDEKIILEHIVEKIEQTAPFFEVVATAMNGEDALELVKCHRPDVLFTDVKMPLMDGIELTRQVKMLYPDIHIVILSGYDNFAYAQQALRLGVSDYLLKPMTRESLQDTLDEIRLKLEQRNRIHERNIITQDLNGLQPSISPPLSLQSNRFMLYLICLGNLCRYVMDDIDAQNTNKIWSMVQWDQMMDRLESTAKWWVIDDKNYNVKFLIMTTKEKDMNSPKNIANEIQSEIRCFIQQSCSVTLSTHMDSVSLNDLWETAQTLRKSLDKGLIPCQSTIIRQEEKKLKQEHFSPLDPVTASSIEKFVKQGKFEPLTSEIARLLEEWSLENYTQHELERSLIELARLLFDRLDVSKPNSAEIESGIYRIVATARHADDLNQNMLSLLTSCLPAPKKPDSSEELYIKLKEYIRLNFTKAINVDHLAHTFQFNASYIIRVFKKYHGMPPLQYLISLRIQEAKRMIEEKPEMDFKDISEIIGYTDQHYFSRVFRNWTGMNPSEYRDFVHKK